MAYSHLKVAYPYEIKKYTLVGDFLSKDGSYHLRLGQSVDEQSILPCKHAGVLSKVSVSSSTKRRRSPMTEAGKSLLEHIVS